MIVLAGDVGGTNSRLAFVEDGEVTFRRDYDSAAFDGLEPILDAFLREAPAARPLSGAAFGVPGPVRDGACRTTNLPWVVEEARLRAHLPAGLRVRLVNDFQAAALGVSRLDPARRAPLGPEVAAVAGGPVAVLGAGTGLGEAYLVAPPERGDLVVVPSEGSHADFAPRDDEEVALWRFLRRRHGHVSYERVVSGPGLLALRDFYRDEVGVAEAPDTAAALAAAGADAPRVVSERALAGTDEACARALARFCSVFGAEAGNAALKVVATGGVYLAGGIAPKILPALRTGAFRAAFEDKGRYADLLRRIPTWVVLDPDLGLRGAAIALV